MLNSAEFLIHFHSVVLDLKSIWIHVIVFNPKHSVLKLYRLTFHCIITPKPEHVYDLADVFLAKQRLENKRKMDFKNAKLVSRKTHQKSRTRPCSLCVLGATDCPQPSVRWHVVCPKRKLTESWTEYFIPSILLEWTSERRMRVLSFFSQKWKLIFLLETEELLLWLQCQSREKGHCAALIKPRVLYRLWINYRKNHDAVRLLRKFNHELFTVDSGTHHSQISVFEISPTTEKTSRPTASVFSSICIPAGSVQPLCWELSVCGQAKRTWYIILLGLYSIHQNRMFCSPQEWEEAAGAPLTISGSQH